MMSRFNRLEPSAPVVDAPGRVLQGRRHGVRVANCCHKPVVGFTAGGGTDVTARMVAQKLSENLGQPVVVENRPGASASIAAAKVATSPADGYTLLMVTAADTILPALRAKLSYDVERDFAPVSLVAIAPFVLVIHPSVPANTVNELIALARAQIRLTGDPAPRCSNQSRRMGQPRRFTVFPQLRRSLYG